MTTQSRRAPAFRWPALVWVLLSFGIGAAALPGRASAQGAATDQARAPSVTVVEAAVGQITQTAVISGTLVARDEVLVASQLDGFAIVEILVEEGDRVQAGQVLARLARDTLEASLAQNSAQIGRAEAAIQQASSSIAEAEANQVQAQASFERAKSLREGGFTSGEVFDQRQATAQTTTARVASARQSLRLAEADKRLAEAQRQELLIRLNRTEIKAPVGGIVSRRTARIGAMAAMASDPLFRIIADGAIELEADVAETTLARVSVGQKGEVYPAGWTKPASATVRLVSPEVGKTTRLGRVRLALDLTGRDGDDGAPPIAIGSFARGLIKIARSEGVLVPQSAVMSGPDGARIQVVRDGIVETRRIVPGIRAGAQTEVVEGLAAGEQVVAISGTFLRNGDRVIAVPPATR